MEFYTTRKEYFTSRLVSLKKQYNSISIIRFIIAVTAIVLCYYSIKNSSFGSYIYPLAICIILFVLLMKIHGSIANKKLRAQTLIAINEDEVRHIKRERSNFENGAEYIDFKHPYSYDLDIFGEHSLFQHLNRTETFKGKEKLAQMLLTTLPHKNISENQEAIKELTGMPEWRQEIQVLGRMKKDSQATYNKLISWCSSRGNGIGVVSYVLAIAGPVALGLCFIAYLLSGMEALFNACTSIFVFNLFMVLGKAGTFKKEINTTTEIGEILQQYSLIIKQAEEAQFKSKKLTALQQELSSGSATAGQLIKKLAILFSQMDTVSNIFAAIILNGLFQYHVHIYKTLYNWKKQHAAAVEGWLTIIGAFEALSSIANFYYNNKEYTFPELNTGYEITFKNVTHPLLNPVTRVGNDITFSPRFTILTGSNMSGKSTFLRTLGVNMVLAGAGAPVCADNASIHPLPVLVSMRLSDSLSDSESYFFAEIKRLKQIMDAMNKERSFVLLDEILRGTNSDDKRSGTIAVVKKMMAGKAIGAIATHDIEVCNITAEYPEQLINRCFEVEITDNELYFDYKLRNDVCRNKSATFLMQKTGVI